MSNKIFINCDEATAICNKNQYKEASFWEKLKLGIHIFICKKCRQYSKQNIILTEVCNKHLHKGEDEHKLTEKEKEVLQTEVVKRIK
jgi:hypothetical protein